jgi:hypothetical protein
MFGKRILAGIFAGMILLKLIILTIYPQLGVSVAEKLLGYSSLVIIISLALLVISGYYIFTSLNLIDVALVMLFTGFLISATSAPYFAELLKTRAESFSFDLSRAWLPWLIWGILAVAVLYKTWNPDRGRWR